LPDYSATIKNDSK